MSHPLSGRQMQHLATTETPAETRKRLRSIRWTHPKELRWLRATETATARILRAIDKPHSPDYAALFGAAPLSTGGVRRRRKRSDGAINSGSLLCAAIGAADVASGMVAKPVGGEWVRNTWNGLGKFAFGTAGEDGPYLVEEALSKRRIERCASELVKMGLIRSVQWRKQDSQGNYRSEPGLKFITDKCWKLLGVIGLVLKERRKRDQEKNEKNRANVAKLVTKHNDGRRRNNARPSPTPAETRPAPMHLVATEKPPDRSPSDAERLARKAQLNAFADLLGTRKPS